MRWTVLVRSHAEGDLAEARAWYERKRIGLGDEFLDAFADAMQALELSPDRQHLYYRNFRRVLFRRFPYKVFYQIIEKRVVIFRVLHASQDHQRRF